MAAPTAGSELARFSLPVDASKARELAVSFFTPTTHWIDGTPADQLNGRVVTPAVTFTSFFWHDREALMWQGLGLDQSATLHGEHRWRLHQPLRVGQLLRARTTLEPEREATGGRAGRLRVLTLATSYRDARDGAPVVDEQHVLLALDAPTAATPAGSTATRPVPPPGTVPLTQSRRVGPVTRRDIVRCAGATGDFNRIHCDEPYAHEVGLPGVFAMGKLQAGIVIEHLLAGAGDRYPTQVAVRFIDRVWPGDDLEVDGWWDDASRTTCTLYALRGDAPVVRCTAAFAPPADALGIAAGEG